MNKLKLVFILFCLSSIISQVILIVLYDFHISNSYSTDKKIIIKILFGLVSPDFYIFILLYVPLALKNVEIFCRTILDLPKN